MKFSNVVVRIPKERGRQALSRLGAELERVFEIDLLNRNVVEVVRGACVWVGLPLNFDAKGKDNPFQATQLCAMRIRFNDDGTADAETVNRGVASVGDWEAGVKHAIRLTKQLLLGLERWTKRHTCRAERIRTNAKRRNRS